MKVFVWQSEEKMHIFNVIVAGVIIMLNNNGTWAIWISLEGCYGNVSGVTDNHTLAEKNGPRHCFGVCPNSTYIGLQDNFCLCDAKPLNYRIETECNHRCRGETVNLPCGSESAIYIYRQEMLHLESGVHGEFGNVYVSVSRDGIQPQFSYNATSNTSEEHKLICYADYDTTICNHSPLGNEATWEVVHNKCLDSGHGLIPYHAVETRCFAQAQAGTFWIGVIWMIPVFIVTSKDTTTSIIQTSIQSNTITSETRYIPTIINTSSAPGKGTYYKENSTVSRETENKTTIVAVAVSIAVAVLLAVASVVICWNNKCLCFKLHQERNQGGARQNDDDLDRIETGENGQAFPEIQYFSHTPTLPSFPTCVPPGSTYLKKDKPSSSQQTNVHIDQPVEHDTSNQDGENGDNGQNKKRRKKDKKGRHKVRPADETDEMAVNKDRRSLHPDVSENEMKQDKKKKKKKKKARKTYDEEPDDNSAISGKTVVPHSLGHERNVSSAFKVKLTELIQDGTASNVNTSEDLDKGTQDNESIHQEKKKKKRKRERDLAHESLENTVDKIREKERKKQKRKKKKRDDRDTVHESL